MKKRRLLKEAIWVILPDGWEVGSSDGDITVKGSLLSYDFDFDDWHQALAFALGLRAAEWLAAEQAAKTQAAQ